jgi:YD repeat-containing protein
VNLTKTAILVALLFIFPFLAFGAEDSETREETSSTPSAEDATTPQQQATQALAATLSGGEPTQALQPLGRQNECWAGSFDFTYPIEIPPGTNGMAPELALHYNSSFPNDIFGVGFSLDGLAKIERDPSYGVTFTSTDHYLYQEEKLFLVGSAFHTERESYERITAYKAGNPTSNPNDADYWCIERKDGSRLWFGTTADSRIEAVGMGGLPRCWALSKHEDVNGNYYTVTYDTDPAGGDYYPAKIVYTQGNGRGTFKAVLFTTEARPDHGVTFVSSLVDMDKRVSRILVKAGVDANGNGGSQVREYRISYGTPNRRSVVTSIQLYGANQESLPATCFTRTSSSGAYSTSSFAGYSGDYRVYTGDFNGDGRMDLFMHSDSINDVVHLSRGDGTYQTIVSFTTPILSGYVFYPGDYNGDGKTDLFAHRTSSDGNIVLLSNGNGYFTDTHTPFSGYNGYTIFTGDFDGDGRTDLFMHCDPYDNAVNLSRGDGTFQTVLAMPPSTLAKCTLCLGDYSGDGKTDLFAHNNTTNANKTFISNGNGYFTDTNTPFYGYSSYAIYAGDFNGDGKSDLFMHSDTVNDVIHFSRGNGSYQTIVSFSSPILSGYTFYPGDFDGDMRTDLYAHRESTNMNITLLSNGDGYFTDTNQPFSGYNGSTIFAVDLNGDGKSDTFVHSSTTGTNEARLSSGPLPDLLGSVSTENGGTYAVTYTPTPQVPGAVVPSSSVYPYVANANPHPVVTQVRFDGGLGEQTILDYGYCEGKRYLDVRPRSADLGFRQVIRSNTAGGSRTVTTYRQERKYRGLVESEYCSDWNGTVEGAKYTGERSAYGERVISADVSFIYLQNRVNQLYDGEASPLEAQTDYEYGEYGDLTKATQNGFTGATQGKDKTEVIFEYVNSASYYVVKPKTRIETGFDYTGLSGNARSYRYYYDGYALGTIGKGLLTKAERFDGVSWINERAEHYADGNIHFSWDANDNRRELSFDSPYNDLISSRTNPLQHVESTAYDTLRRPIAVTDANGNVRRTAYDGFGRATSFTAPTDYPAETETLEYSDVITPVPFPRYVHTRQRESGSAYLERYDYYDGLGRLVQTKREGIAPKWITIDYYYDGAGRNYKTSVPYETSSLSWSGRDASQKATV